MEGVFERGIDEWELGLDIIVDGAGVLPDVASVDWLERAASVVRSIGQVERRQPCQ
jgi:hypothetical protein